jgi:acyl-CoA reductase-like NAD-dependent aldehyde dehydrogenase
MFNVINPADETVICQSVAATPEDVELAVDAARKAFDDGEWRKMDDFQRGKLIYKLADLIE